MPVMRGHLSHDITYVGFPIDPEEIDKYFFILRGAHDRAALRLR